jgi:flagellar protein FliO/FliZ
MTFLDALKLFLPLILICGLLYGLLIFVKKFSFKKGKNSPLNIKVVNSQMIMPKKFISVVKINDKLLVLGISEGSINLLKEVQAEDAEIAENNDTDSKPQFADIFRKFLRK